MVPPYSHRIPRVRWYSGYRSPSSYFAYRTLTVSGRASHPVRLYFEVFISVRTPAVLLLPVWPLPISLATTFGISFDFSSSGYLDVSVPRVAPLPPMCSGGGRRASTARRVFPFGDPRVKGRVPLTADYRSLPRPSSASCAKASAACPYHLPSISDGMVYDSYGPVSGTLGVILHEMRSSRRKSSLVTLCSSQGTARASPGDRTPRGPGPRATRGRSKGPEAWRLGLTGRPVVIVDSLDETRLSLERR